MTTAIVAGIMTGVAAPAAAQGPDVVLPILTCVEPVPHPTEFRLRAHFGYVSTYSSEVTIPIGQNNFFTPGATNRGQPTIFVPGFHPRQFSTEWAVSGSSTRITWVMAGGTAAARNHTGFLCNVRARGPWDPAETYELGDVVTVSIAGAAEPFVLLETGCSPT